MRKKGRVGEREGEVKTGDPNRCHLRGYCLTAADVIAEDKSCSFMPQVERAGGDTAYIKAVKGFEEDVAGNVFDNGQVRDLLAYVRSGI